MFGASTRRRHPDATSSGGLAEAVVRPRSGLARSCVGRAVAGPRCLRDDAYGGERSRTWGRAQRLRAYHGRRAGVTVTSAGRSERR